MRNTISYHLILSLTFSSVPLCAQSDHLLWYDEPATYFEESLVLGNGKMGASVFGGATSDEIFLNDASLWSGEPVDPGMNPEAFRYIPAIRQALKDNDNRLADSLYRHVQGSFSESYAPLGTLFLDFGHDAAVNDYYRELDLSRAVATTRYKEGDTSYQREYFISHPDSVMVIKCTSSREGTLGFTIRFNSLLKYRHSQMGDVLLVDGYTPYHTEPGYRGNMENAVLYDERRGTRFTTAFRIIGSDGKLQVSDSTLSFSGGSRATILVSIATSFNGFDKDPAKEGRDNRAQALDQLEAASAKTFDGLLSDHLGDYQPLYQRVQLELGETDAPDLPTDQRLMRYAEGKEDKNLEVLYFQFGRYLLIASSRTPEVPANLQGIWNPYLRPPWSSNYTININTEENYWLAEVGNLSEMHLPLLGFIENLARTGKRTAKDFYGMDGWTAAHNSDIWAMSNPVGDFGKGDPVWANWTMGGAWLSTHLWEHYAFTGDTGFLRDKAYPLMKGAATFCMEWLVEDGNGYLITSPSTSPENLYVTPEGYTGATLAGATADLAIIRELFQQTVRASQVLGTDSVFRGQLTNALGRLYPYRVGKKGNLREWYYDWDDADPKHRHQSHLFGLYPGHQITPDKTPELADACRKTLEIKGDETTGWSKGWRINLWARLWDGNHAYKMYRELLHYVVPDGVATDYARGGGTYPNLFDAHPPFQIDGNFGGSAAVAEMLVQSANNEIRLLPALPDAWKYGSVEGLRARGGFEISMAWENKKITALHIFSQADSVVHIVSGDRQEEITLKAGQWNTIAW